MTDFIHHIPSLRSMGLGVGAGRLPPEVGVLYARRASSARIILPVFFVGLGPEHGRRLQSSGALKPPHRHGVRRIGAAVSDPYYRDVPVLYWGAFFYHFFLASEISMLATSIPILMNVANAHGFNPLWIGMVWTFAAGGKLFVYQSSVLVVGYSYGYFRHSDMIKIGIFITLVEFVLLVLTVALWWPLLGIVSR